VASVEEAPTLSALSGVPDHPRAERGSVLLSDGEAVGCYSARAAKPSAVFLILPRRDNRKRFM
jgi:hypothetical protein